MNIEGDDAERRWSRQILIVGQYHGVRMYHYDNVVGASRSQEGNGFLDLKPLVTADRHRPTRIREKMYVGVQCRQRRSATGVPTGSGVAPRSSKRLLRQPFENQRNGDHAKKPTLTDDKQQYKKRKRPLLSL